MNSCVRDLHSPQGCPSDSYTPDIAAEIDTLEDQLSERFEHHKPSRKLINEFAGWHRSEMEAAETEGLSKTLARVIVWLIKRDNAQMAAYCMAFAAGLDELNGISMTAVAEKLGVTRAAISKGANECCDELGLPRITKYMRSEQARENCSAAQNKNHWRKNGINKN